MAIAATYPVELFRLLVLLLQRLCLFEARVRSSGKNAERNEMWTIMSPSLRIFWGTMTRL